MIQPKANGTFDIVFPGYDPVNVPQPTDAELAAYTFANDGYWLNLLEKAYGKTRHLGAENCTAEPLDSTALTAGSCGEIITLLTGHSVLRINFQTASLIDLKQPPTVPIKLACPPPAPLLIERTRAVLKDTFAQHKIATASKLRHAYTITEYDIGKDRVALHNPYGRTGWERWPDGTRGPHMSNGYFSCSVPDLVRFFRCVSVER
jgi:hypothetical protein